ncbi:hypothetical protein ULMS_09500 [Patiriisocius marinistellae]|uniref:CusB-like beta-barrel domain-containing protein n=1 Tax=Patiriisocius marinistellae TaxID=2494560 RepID=A0A5J4FWA6_9FLAO|nr:efflux RND transporter periplasmic adaptor subunit [Patiriisocius marinistellae]GEQ85442.1 hypothetical protein ULMS_09500 [Patiriisocius marinistellae]
MRNIILILLGVLLIVGAVLGSNYLIENNNKPKPVIEKVVSTVFVKEAKNDTVAILIPANGTLEAKNKLELFAEVQGLFQSSAQTFKAGQPFNKGQTLISINAAEFYASVQASKSEFINLVTSLMPDLRLDYPEAFPTWDSYLKSLKVDGSLPPLPEIKTDAVNYFITGRGVQASYYSIKNLEQRLGKYSIRAPFNGILTETLVTKGTLVRQGQKLGEYIDTSVFELELAIAKEFSDLLELNEEVSLAVPESDETYKGKVSRINGRIDPATQTIKVFVEVKNENQDLKEGMYLEAQLEARKQENAIEISRKLLVDENKVFVVKDTVLDLIKINPVYFAPNKVVIQGIPDGSKLVSKPIPGAYVGMLVKINEETNNQ